MKRLLFLFIVVILSFSTVFAQETKRTYTGPTQNPKANVKKTTPDSTVQPNTKTSNVVGNRKGEVYIGYSGTMAQTNAGGGFAGDKKIHHGAQTSVTLYASRVIGLRGDFSVNYRDQKEAFTTGGSITTVTRRTAIYNILGGVQLKDSESESFVQPFAHALVGVGVYRQSLRDCRNPIGTFCGNTVKGSGLAGAFGGGLDFNFAERAGIRVTSDYNPMRIQKQTINNFRFGVGVVFK